MKQAEAKLLFITLPTIFLLLPSLIFWYLSFSAADPINGMESIGENTASVLCFWQEALLPVRPPPGLSDIEIATFYYNLPADPCVYPEYQMAVYVLFSPLGILIFSILLPYFLYKQRKIKAASIASLCGLLLAGNTLLLLMLILQAILLGLTP